MRRRQLTTLMRRALAGLARGEPAKGNTRRGLAKRGLVDSAGKLTPAGWCQAVALLPLAEQCSHLGLPLTGMTSQGRFQSPEWEAPAAFQKAGFAGVPCEGCAVLLLIRAAALPAFRRWRPDYMGPNDVEQRFTEAQMATMPTSGIAEVHDACRGASEVEVARRLDRILQYRTSQQMYPGAARNGLISIFRELGGRHLAAIALAIGEAPYVHRSGWPDLTVAREGVLQWVEVKTTDTLHVSQIQTLTRMRELLPGEVKVLQVQQG